MTELIKSVKVLNNETVIEFEDITVTKETKSKRTKSDKIADEAKRHPDFDSAILEVASFIPEMLELAEHQELEFKGVSIDRKYDSVMLNGHLRWGAKAITGGSQVNIGPLFKKSKDGNNQISVQFQDALTAFLVEAEAYATRDKKAQMSLLDEKTDEELDEEEKRSISTPPGVTKIKTKKRKGVFRKDVMEAIAGNA